MVIFTWIFHENLHFNMLCTKDINYLFIVLGICTIIKTYQSRNLSFPGPLHMLANWFVQISIQAKFHTARVLCSLSLFLSWTVLSLPAFFFFFSMPLTGWRNWFRYPMAHLTFWICLIVSFLSHLACSSILVLPINQKLYPKAWLDHIKLFWCCTSYCSTSVHKQSVSVWLLAKRYLVLIAWFHHYKVDNVSSCEDLFHHNISYNGLSICWCLLPKSIIYLGVINGHFLEVHFWHKQFEMADRYIM